MSAKKTQDCTDPLSLRSVKVGDVVVMDSGGRETREVQITKVGRRYLRVGEREFHFDGRTTSGYSYPTIRTLAEHEQRVRDADARRELREMGFDLGWCAPRGWSWTEVRDALAPIARAKASQVAKGPEES